MNYLFGFIALLLAGAIVVLFAMLGELSTRVGPGFVVDTSVDPLPDALIGNRPGSWPEELAPLGGAEGGTALVLSTSCNTCNLVAQQLRTNPGLADGLSLVISTSDAARAVRFIGEHDLGRLPHFVDVGGDWVSTEFNVQASPSALTFRHGRLVSALMFADVASVRAVEIPDETDVARQEESWDTPVTSPRA